jgi:ATP-binding cassette, subfamily F, member 3
MSLISAERISKRFGDKSAFEQVSLSIEPTDRIALVGRNGAGKTTLLQALAGELLPDSGAVHRSGKLKIDFVKQEIIAEPTQSLRDFVESARQDLQKLSASISATAEQLAQDPNNSTTLSRYDDLSHRFEIEGGFDFENDVNISLAAFGFSQERWGAPLSSFSGGENNRAALLRALLGSGDILFLDEPTNHLDIESTEWLEKRLLDLQRAFVIVSHDRTFLNNLVNVVWDLSFGTMDVYHEGFATYLRERPLRWERRLQEFQRQQAHIVKTEQFIRKNLAGQKTKQAQSRRKQLAKVKRIEAPKTDEKAPGMKIAAGSRSFSHVLSVTNLATGYGQTALLEGVNLDVYRGNSIGLIGKNGSGKTTLVKTLLGELPAMAGECRFGRNVEIGYFDQTLGELDEPLTALEHMVELDPLAKEEALRSYLARYGFFGDETMKQVATLSGGEKTKLSLALLMYRPTNLLIFDEPTNHLDIESREALEKALRVYDGAYIVISHDRYFLDNATKKTLAIEGSTIHEYAGPYSYYVRKRAEREQAPKSAPRENDYRSFKELARRKTAAKKKVQTIGSRISELELELEQLDQSLRGGIPSSDWERLTETSARKTEVEQTLLELYQSQEDLKAELGLLTGETP